MNIEIRHLRQFLVTAEELHFTRASERLHIAQPALSAQIKKLEATLHLNLFQRDTRSVSLTPEGREFVVQARAAVEAYDSAMASALQLRTAGAGHYTLGINPRTKPQIRKRVLELLQEINPLVSVDFIAESSVRLVEAVLGGHLDVALCLAPVMTAGIQATLVKSDSLLVAVPSIHKHAGKESLQLTDLSEEEWILPSSRVFASNSLMQDLCVQAGFTMRVSSALSDYDDEFTSIVEGRGIEVVPVDFVRTREVAGVSFVPLRDVTLPVYLINKPGTTGAGLACVHQAVAGAINEGSGTAP